jgi:hypothetical protein
MKIDETGNSFLSGRLQHPPDSAGKHRRHGVVKSGLSTVWLVLEFPPVQFPL